VKVQFNPANDEWRLFVRNDGGSKGDAQTLNDSHCKGANVDATYTSSNLAIMGIYACVPDDNNLRSTRWDNIRIKVGVPLLGCPSTTSLCGAYSICNTPVINSQPTNQPICSSGNATISVSTSPSSEPFQWQYYNGTSWVNVTNGSPSGFSYTNQTTSSLSISTSNANCGDYQFRVITGSSGCSVNSNSAIVSVIRAERIAPTGQQCSETLINFNACPTGATYSWNVTAPSGTSSNPNSGNGQTFSFTPTNNSGLSQTFNVSASITYQGLACPFTFSPTIVSPSEAGVISGASDVCVGSTLNLTSNGNSGGTWTSSNNAIASVNSSGVVTANSVGSATITYTVNATTPCTGTDIATTSISVFDGLNAGTLSSNNQTLCVGNTTLISTNGNPGGSWISSNNNVATIDANGLVTGVSPGTATITYTVSSANCGGATESSTINLTVESSVDAGILSSNATTICVGNTTTISSNGTSGGAWSSSNNSIATVDANGVVTGVNPGTVTINYQVTSSNCGGSTDNETLTITVSSTADAGTLSSNNTTICVGGTSSISTTGNPGGSWTSSDNNVVTIDANGLVTGISSGMVTITYTVNSSNCGGTSESSTISITVTPGSNAGVISGVNSLCEGETTTINTNGDLGGTWSSSNTNIATINSVGLVTAISSGIVTLTYTVSSANCSGLSDVATYTLTINEGPNAGILSGLNGLCQGGSTTITSNGDIGGNWTSSNPNVVNVNPNGEVIAVAPGLATITYTVSATSVGCSNSLPSSTSSINIVVNPTPTVSVNNATICPGASANLIATPSVNGGTFNWTPGGQTSNSILVSPSLNTTYNVVYSINGCSSSPASAVVTINQIISVSFTANQTSGCVPLTIQFNSVGSNLTDCVWSFGGVETANGCAVTHTFDSPGCFDVILTSNQNGCSTSSTQTSFICVEDQPISSFSVSPTTFSESSDLVNFSNNSIGASSYIWSFGDGQNSNLENPSHFYLNTTNGIIVQLIAFSDSGCSDTSVVSIPYQEGETFYVPNSFTPDEDEHNQVFVPVFTSGFDPYNFQMLIFDRWGELVFESNDSKIGWDGTNGLNGHKFQDGTYTWKISFKNLYNDKRKSVVGHVTLIR
jgi:gliding motility-associated-like protein